VSRRHTIACLAGNGVGPELMAQATRALAAAARPHGLRLDEVHPPFGSEAFMQMGHPLPASTRRAYREADAVLVAGDDPALAGVEADLDLRAGLVRVLVPGRADVAVVFPLYDGRDMWAVERAFELACMRRGRLTAVGADVAALADARPGLGVELLAPSPATALIARAPERFDVVLTDRALAEALVHVVAFGAPGRLLAFGRLSPAGPGLFFPDHGAASEDAGQGSADPGPMLLAAALALGEGLLERPAARTLEAALAAARLGGRNGGAAATTRERTDAVLAVLPSAIATAEFVPQAAA
jgi:3-isopropylmalate dehydrogenase